MARPKKATAKKVWKYQVGVRPHTVTAFERVDKKDVVALRWWPAGANKYSTKSLGIYLRDDRGVLVPARVVEAQQKTKAAYTNLVAGVAPGAPTPGSAPANTKLTLTLQEGFDLAFAEKSGMFDDIHALHVKEMQRYRDRVLSVLPGTRTWESIVPNDYVTLWRTLATRFAQGQGGGRTATERCIIILAQTARWLSGGRLINRGAAEPDPKWQPTFEKAWATITGQRHQTAKPRHSPVELGRLFQALAEGKGDPRLRLLFSLAAEARMGQGARAMRSWLTLGEAGIRKLGRFHIPDYGKKKGVLIDLTVETRGQVDAALTTGYLRDLEAEFQRSGRDYPLFPGSRLVAGIARTDVLRPIGKRALTDLWHEFEVAAGVAVMPGRGWYGVRRKTIDLAQHVEQDPRALNRITGHRSSETRVGYQDGELVEIVEKAAAAIEGARGLAVAAAVAAAATGAPAAPATPSQWELNQTAKQQRRRDKHSAEEMARRIAAGLPVSV